MKIRVKISVVIVFMAIFSCDKLDELTEFDVTDSFATTINISISEPSDESQTFTQNATLDIASNNEIADNLDLIQNITINAITYEISNYNGDDDAIVTNASLSFNTINIDVGTLNLKQSDDNDTILTIENSQQLNAIGNILENSSSISASLTGTISSTPVSFNVIINVDLTATIDVI